MRVGIIAGVFALAATLAATGAARAAPGGPVQACGRQAARYENGKGFALVVIRAGEVRIVNPLRPLTPDVTQVLEVVIGTKRATAYGPDFTALRRGGPPGAMQNALGAPITWETALPPLPESLGIVADDGSPLADLAFQQCEAPPAIAPEPAPQAARKGGKPKGSEGKRTEGKGTEAKPGTKAAAKPAAKTPGGFSMPEGAIAE